MFTSSKYSYLALRLGIAVVFLWFGIDKFLHPAYWVNAWVTSRAITFIRLFGLASQQLVYITGVLEILIGLSLVTEVFIKFFSVLGIIFLFSMIYFLGINETVIRGFGLVGGFVAVILWPNSRSRF